MPLTTDALQLQAELDAAVDRIVDQQARDLVRAWATAWDEVAGDLRDTVIAIAADTAAEEPVPRARFARSARLQLVLAYIGQQLTTLAADAGVRIVQDVEQVVADAAGAQSSLISAMLLDSPLPAGVRPLPVETSALDLIVKRTTEQITSQLKPLQPAAYDAVRRELIRGVAAGIGPRDVAAQMVGRAEGQFNGGLTRALTISRTEMLDAHRGAAQYAQDRHASVLVGWTWLTHLTPTTCRSCIAQNGTVHDLAEPGPLDHQQGRCSRIPTTKPWSDLGVDVDEPDGVALPDSEQFFASLTVAEQQKILGLDGYRAWKAGRWPMSAWSTVRTTSGWRDSHVPAKPPR
jgi:hypothetical protein